jgi:hypothetical protein
VARSEQEGMTIKHDKILVKKTREEEVITYWIKPKGFDLSMTTLTLPVLKLSLNLALGSLEEFKRFCKSEYGNEIDIHDCNACVISFRAEDGTQWHWMLCTKQSWYAEDYGVMAHELHHFVHAGLDEKGCTYGAGGEEIYAYIQGYFMELVVRAFMMLGKPKGKKNA